MGTTAQVKAWRLANPKKAAAIHKRYYENHKEAVIAASKKWAENHKEKVGLNQSEWREKNKERMALVKKAYAQKNKDRVNQWVMARNAIKLTTGVGNVDYRQLLAEWNGRCGICREVVVGKYHVDHIIPLVRKGAHVQNNLQVTHPKCNLSKGSKLMEQLNRR